MGISKKKSAELYEVVHEDIMKTRVKIWSMRNDKNVSISLIDDLLYNLTISAPKKAIEIFK
jgi:hypothetical protein